MVAGRVGADAAIGLDAVIALEGNDGLAGLGAEAAVDAALVVGPLGASGAQMRQGRLDQDHVCLAVGLMVADVAGEGKDFVRTHGTHTFQSLTTGAWPSKRPDHGHH